MPSKNKQPPSDIPHENWTVQTDEQERLRRRFFGIGGAGVSPIVEKFLREAKFPYCIGYGLTETAPLLAGTNPSLTKYRAIGPVIPGTELQLRDMDKKGYGTLWAKGPNIMMGYYKEPQLTKEVITV